MRVDNVKEMLEKRLSELKAERTTGENMLAELRAKEASLQQTLLRISGAIQVLEETLAQSASEPPSKP